MSESEENVLDVVAEILNHGGDRIAYKIAQKNSQGVYTRHSLHFKEVKFTDIADRLKSAIEREAEKVGRTGDAVRLREALNVLCFAAFEVLKTHVSYPGFEELGKALDKAKAALAEPPRNCDVGTAGDQVQRMHKFCVKHGLYKGFVDDYKCENCPLQDKKRCELEWGQLPYDGDMEDEAPWVRLEHHFKYDPKRGICMTQCGGKKHFAISDFHSSIMENIVDCLNATYNDYRCRKIRSKLANKE